MSSSSRIKLINENQNIYIQESNQINKQIPRWLLEFNQEIHVGNSSSENRNSRPSTENNLINRPKWFEELSQKRRMSDIGNMNLDKTLFESSNKKNYINHKAKLQDLDVMKEFQKKSLLNDIKHGEIFKSLDDLYMPSIAFNHFQEKKQKKLPVRNKSSGGQYEDDVHSYDDHLFSFSSTFKSIENLKLDEIVKSAEEECVIPEMPTGNELRLILMENWGNQHFIGLNGIEILDHLGNRPQIKNMFLENNCQNRFDMNDLSKLIDNVYRTHDDAHIWQCRFDDKLSLPICIIFQFDKPTTIALIRIWNHNKSRIHSYCGVKYAKVKLDEQTIFCGEIAKANGDLIGSLENFGDTIIFTTNDEVLEQISHYDISFQKLLMDQMN